MNAAWMRDRLNAAARDGEVVKLTGSQSVSSPGTAPRRKGHDPVHTYRAPAALVAEARGIAIDSGTSLSNVIRAALEQYVQQNREGN